MHAAEQNKRTLREWIGTKSWRPLEMVCRREWIGTKSWRPLEMVCRKQTSRGPPLYISLDMIRNQATNLSDSKDSSLDSCDSNDSKQDSIDSV